MASQREEPPMHSVNVGERMRQLRRGLGMSVRALATTTGFSPSLISQAENNQVTPSIGSLERIAMALGVNLSQFFAEPETRCPFRKSCASTF
jgi:transcriptional regulator with XRE-family HTH domain